MSVYVYQFGLRPPVEGERIVREQLRAAHEYRNTLVAIERGRRHALRAIDDADDGVQAAKELVKTATRSTRKARVSDLRAARKRARERAADELAAIAEREHEILLAARADTTCFWGSYLDIEAAHRQSRAQPLYGDDALTPNDPAFIAGPRWRDVFGADDHRSIWYLARGQVGVQIQGGLATPDVLACTDTRVRLDLRAGMLWLRVGSSGREPVWAKWPIRVHRAIPDAARWKWVRVSVRPEADVEHWTCEITLDDPSRDRVRELSRPRDGDVIALEWQWTELDTGGIRVARMATREGVEDVVLPARIVGALRKPSDIQAVRDVMRNEMQERLATAIKQTTTPLPRYVREAANVMHLWRSARRFEELLLRWRADGGSGDAHDILDIWYGGRRWGDPKHVCRRPCRAWHGDLHLRRWQDCGRAQALRRRQDFFRAFAAKLRSRATTVILSDQDLSVAARYADDSDVRFIAGCSYLRTALRQAFGGDAIDARWRDGVEDEGEWCERSRSAWIAGGARGDGFFAAERKKTVNAWRERKEKSASKGDTAREPSCSAAE